MSADFADSGIANDTMATEPERRRLADAWGAIDQAIEELAALARTDANLARFFHTLLTSAVRTIGASGGIVWHGDDRSPLEPLAQLDMAPRQVPGRSNEWTQRTEAASAADHTVVVPATSNPYAVPLLVGVIHAHDKGVFIIELALLADSSRESQQRSAQLLDIFLEVAADFDRQRELFLLRQTNAEHRQFDQLIEHLHASLDPLATAYSIANDGRRWIGCDRLSVVRVGRGKPRVLAMSGVDHPNRDAAEVRALARIGAVTAAQGEVLFWQEGSIQEWTPPVSTALNEYLDLSSARRMVLWPMSGHRGQAETDEAAYCCGVLVAETYDERLPLETLRKRTEAIGRHGGSALAAALAHHDIPLLPLQKRLGVLLRFLSRRRVALSVGIAAAALMVLSLIMVPVDFSVEARGTLRPSEYRHVFAPEDGVVERILIRPGQAVVRGAPVVQLRDPALELEFSRTAGELQTAYARLAAIQARRSTRRAAEESRADERQWAAEEEQLKEHIRGLESQQTLLSNQRSALQVSSPIDGTLMTWNVEELLSDRPVKQGQLLLTVADPTSPWLLELKVADTRAGYVLQAWNDGKEPPKVTFLLATEPAVTHRGRLTNVASRIELGEEGLSLLATARLDGSPPSEARAGAGVIARIHCGRRAAGYVWLHDFVDAARRYWF